MNLFKEIPKEKYNNTQYCYEYLNNNKIIGNEETEYNGIFHLHWRGPINNDKILLQIKSTLATQEVKKIYLWIEDFLVTMNSPNYPKILQFNKFVQTRIFNRDIINMAPGNQKNKDKIIQYFEFHHRDYRYKTDIFRWIILSIYGGVYTDADTLLLRDLRNIRIKNWSSKWGVEEYAEACILKLEKGSNVYEQMYLNNPNNPKCFLLLANSMPAAYDFRYDNLKFTSLPSDFFDIAWGKENKTDLEFLVFNNMHLFFKKTDKDINLNNFFKGCFAYHWHNQWNELELKNSFAGRLNQDFDRIIKDKYNITPVKIFIA